MTAATKKGTEVAVKEQSALATIDYGDDAGTSFATLGNDSLAIPFINVLQPLSPEIDAVEGAKAGKFYNSVTQMMADPAQGITVIPCEAEHSFVEWIPREKGGGIAGRHKPDSEFVKAAKAAAGQVGTIKLPNGNDLIETFYMFVVKVNDDGSAEPAVIPFKSTGIKTFRNWRTKISLLQIALPDGRRINPPSFAHRFVLTSHKEKNAKGEWWMMDVKFDGEDAVSARLAPSDGLYQQARDFALQVRKGTVTMAAESAGPAAPDASTPTDKF